MAVAFWCSALKLDMTTLFTLFFNLYLHVMCIDLYDIIMIYIYINLHT